MVSSLVRKLRSFLAPERRISPRKIHLEASSFCQLKCPSCPTTTRAIHPAVASGFLKFENFKTLIDTSPRVRQVELSNYGEVFLNPELPQILRYGYEKKIALRIENGANLNNVKDETLEALVKYRVRALRCSIDGASADTYRTYRVRGDFETVIENIKKLNVFKKQYRSALPKLTWQFIVFGHNEHEIPLARAMAKNLGMTFDPKLTWDDSFSPIRDKEFVRGQIGKDYVSRGEYEEAKGKKYYNEICFQLWDRPQINWDGKVLGCSRNFWGDFGGNAFNDGLEESLNNSKIAYARDMLKGREPMRPDIPCVTCELYQDMQKTGTFIADR